MSYSRSHQKKASFLEKFQGKISTVSKDGNLKSVSRDSTPSFVPKPVVTVNTAAAAKHGLSPRAPPSDTSGYATPVNTHITPGGGGRGGAAAFPPMRPASHTTTSPVDVKHAAGNSHQQMGKIGVDDLAALIGQSPPSQPPSAQASYSSGTSAAGRYGNSPAAPYHPQYGTRPQQQQPAPTSYRSTASDAYSYGTSHYGADAPDSPPHYDDYDDDGGMYDNADEQYGGGYGGGYGDIHGHQPVPQQPQPVPPRQRFGADSSVASSDSKAKRSGIPRASKRQHPPRASQPAIGSGGYARAHRPPGGNKDAPGFREMAYIRKPESMAAQDTTPKEESYSPEEALYFSKKARPVEYKPKTLKEYKAQKSEEYYELGGLGVDLNDEELVAQRAKKERMKAYAKKVRQLQKPPSEKKDLVSEIEKRKEEERRRKIQQSRRAKAREYAKKIPKPKPVEESEDNVVGSYAEAHRDRKAQEYGGNAMGEDEEWSELAALEAAHDAARAVENRIRKEMKGF